MIRSELPPATLHARVTKTVQAVDPNQPVAIRTITSGINRSLRGRQSMLMLVNAFAGSALILACLGIYGVMAYTIGQRQREMGIRMALGASQPNVIALVLRDGLHLALVGITGGVVAAAGGAHLIESFLFGVGAHDALVYITVVAVLAVLAVMSCWFPARRAAHVNPINALRAD